MTMLSRDDTQHGEGLSRAWALVALAAVVLVAGYLRFTGLNWDEGQYIHPDEGHMRNTVSLIRWPDDLSVYFDTHRSPLNVRNNGDRRYSYGTLPLFVTRAVGEWLNRACSSDPAPIPRAAAALLVGSEVSGCGPGTFSGVYSAVVGRALSALSDLGTLVLIYLIGRRLYGEATGLLAAAFGAFTAFLIQQAHFFTVESMACFLVTLVAYFSVRAARAGEAQHRVRARAESPSARPMMRSRVGWLDFALAGLGVGLAAACKVSAATAALVVVLGAVGSVIRAKRQGSRAERRRQTDRSSRRDEALSTGEGGGATARPPTDSVRESSLQMSYLWRLVVALFLAGLLSLVAFRVAQPYAFEGPGFFGVEPSPEWFGRLHQIRMEQAGEVDLPSGRQWANRAPIVFPWLNMVVWGMGLPLGLAGWIGWGVAGFELLGGRRGGLQHLVLWGWFTVVFLYQATRWVKSMRYFLPLYPILLLFAAAWLVRLIRSARTSPRGTVRRWLGLGLSAIVGLGAVFWGVAFFTIYMRPHPRVAASRWIYEHVPKGVTVANEHWDWGLPLRIDGHNPFAGRYTGIEMENYNEDTPRKRQQLYDWLDQADWVFLASNRLYASIPRLPARYPLTIEYYRALFAGELGFELEADFTSYPALGPFVFPDQENPFALMEPDYESQQRPIEVHLPPAEEAFSVYDHPRVLIFRKTEAYSRQLVRAVLGQVELDRVERGRTPWEATQAPNMLRFDDETWAEQQAGGTWSEMFNRRSLLNRYPGLAALAWWASVTLLGWLAFPLLFAALPWLRDRGYALARIFALLLIAYLTWLAASLRLFPNTRPTIVRMVSLLALTGIGVGWLRGYELKAFLRRRWRMVLMVEGLFALLFVIWIGVRMLQPDLWHPVVGGEKPMDFAYLNAVMKSTWFPPYNPWLSGTWINYYYFGFIIVGTFIKLMGTVPAIAYNLVVPLIFALTGVGTFSVAYNLSGVDRADGERRGLLLRGIASGVAALTFTVVLGNLGVVHLLRNKLIELGDVSFPSTIPGLPNAVSFLRGLWRVVAGGATIAMRPETWYWHPTRIIPGEAGNAIAEFPAFTFLYGDLHAHMIAFPLTLFALALAIAWVRTSRPSWGSLLLGGLVIGALRPTNTWDYPTYLLLGVIALGLGAWRVIGRRTVSRSTGATLDRKSNGGSGGMLRPSRLGRFIRRVALPIPALIALTVLFYVPYMRHYVAGYSSFEVWEGGTTPVGIYLWIHAMLLYPVVTRLVVEVVDSARRGAIPRVLAALAAVGGLVLVVVLWTLNVQVALVTVPIIALAAIVFFTPTGSDGDDEAAGAVPERGPRERLLWLLVAAAMALSLGVEILVLEGDIGRMNTVFKFYLQVWVLLSVAGAASLSYVWQRARAWEPGWRRLWWIVMVALVLGGALFLPLGIHGRAGDRMAPETGLTLNGMAFMEDAVIHDGPEGDMEEIPLSGDYHAIRWMQENVEGTPVILEGLGRREYLWANRVSIHTGLPAVVGWRWHQVQQRAGVGGDMVDWRRDDVGVFYNTSDVSEAEEILERYGVRYVYVGGYERAYYAAAGLDKFDEMVEQGLLRVVYDEAGVMIYEVMG